MSNLDNFKDIAEDKLKNIKVTEALKQKTLERCKKEAEGKRKFILPSAVVGIAAALTLVMLNFGWFSGNSGAGSQKIAMESAGTKDSSYMKVEEGNNVDPNSPVSNEGSVSIMMGETDSGTAQSIQPYEGSGQPIYREGTMEEASFYMGSQFKKPEYIPSGYKQDLVQVPTDMSKEGMEVMLSYKNDKKFFTLIMRKGAASLDSLTGAKEININGAKAQVLSGPLMAGEEQVASVFTRMVWLNENVLCTIEGEIAEEEAIKVARSIK